METTSPVINDTVYGPEGTYRVRFRGHRTKDGIGVISKNGAQPLPDNPEILEIYVRIIDGYTVADLETFNKIITIAGYTVEEFVMIICPEGWVYPF